MPTYGLTTEGFVPKSFEVLQEEMNAALRAAFGNSINLTNGILAKFRDIVCERYAELWELSESVYSSQDPDKATATALEALCALTGTLKNPATYSAVVLTLTGTPATLVTEGSRAATFSTAKKFATDADATIVAVDAWAALTGYALGQRVHNDSGKVYQVTTAGTSDASGGPTGTGTGIVDDSVVWAYLGDGTGAVDVAATATETGEIAGYARDINTIDTPVGGWDGVINVLDASLGSDVESDESLRQRRELELAQAGQSTPDAIRAALLEVEDVTAVTVFYNNTDETDADGIPPHAVECLVRGGDDQDIVDAIFANVAAGIATYGTEPVGTVTDTQGTVHDVYFSRPDEETIYIVMGVTYNSRLYPVTGDTLIKQAIVDWGDVQPTGKDAVPSGIIAQAFEVPGVLAVDYIGISTTSISTPTTWAATTAYTSGNVVVNQGRVYRCTTSGTSGSSPGPTTTGTGIADGSAVWAHLGETVSISLRQLAMYDTSRITVISVAGTP
jgi:uncharacterized phage protein gp47/JayE